MGDDSEAARERFYIARAESLNGYALLEQGITFLFAGRLGTSPNYATLIISKIVNTRARNEVVQRIVDHSTQKRFRPFTNALFAEIQKVDSLRNHLVHWHVKVRKDGNFCLRPTDPLSGSDAEMNEGEVDDLRHRCLFLARTALELSKHLEDWSRNPALHERFQQPLRYPPERDDPLYRYYISGEDPP